MVSRGLTESREKAKALILAGQVTVNGDKAAKAGQFIGPEAELEILEKMPYVSRGGIKLEGALKYFSLDVREKIAMDVGSSTGGFTDCLLQAGCKKVYAIDVGYGQMDWSLRNDSRVILLEKTNIRYLSEKIRLETAKPGDQALKDLIESNIDIAAVDVSFISLLKVLPEVIKSLKKNGEIIALVKPQFEVARKNVGKGGIVRNEDKRLEIVEKIIKWMMDEGLELKGKTTSGLPGTKGNIEYFVWFKKIF